MTREEEILRRVREGFDAFNRRDYDGATAYMHPDVELVPAGGQTPIRGREAVRAWMEPNAFERQVIEPLEITLHGTKALIRVHTEAVGAGSGIEVSVDSWSVITMDDDLLVTRSSTYLAHEEDVARTEAQS